MKPLLKICLPLLGGIAMTMSANAELAISNPIITTTTNEVSRADVYNQVPQQVPSDESLIKLLRIMRMDEMMKAMAGSQSGMIEAMMQSSLDDMGEDINEAQRQELINIVSRHAEQLVSESSSEIVKIAENQFIKLAKQHYTQAEVDAQIEFYGSDIGQSILDKQPKLMQEYMMAIMPETVAVIEKYQERIMPQLERDITEILD